MLVLLVRHAESLNNRLLETLRADMGLAAASVAYDAQKKNDPELSDLGERQTARLSSWLPRYLSSMDFMPDAALGDVLLVSSPMTRCLRTAVPIAEELELRCEVWSDTHESKGCWSDGVSSCGPDAAAIVREYGRSGVYISESVPLPAGGWWAAADGTPRPKETAAESSARAWLVADRLRKMALQAPKLRVVILVTHGNWMSLLIGALLRPANLRHGQLLDARAHKHDNTAMSAIVLPGTPDDCCSLVQLNRSEHLDESPQIRRTRQGIRVAGFDAAGRRPSGWQVPADGEAGTLSGCTVAAAVMAAAALLAWGCRPPTS